MKNKRVSPYESRRSSVEAGAKKMAKDHIHIERVKIDEVRRLLREQKIQEIKQAVTPNAEVETAKARAK
jgi:hypothetical protein